MAPKRKLLLNALNNRAGLRFRKFAALVEAFGSELLRINGSHHIFARRNVREIVRAASASRAGVAGWR
ncbi:MAG: type II toxin-antitoxin system HicA family toxin, partial [Chloroflexota bacterium]|nr:type II toxin-antitoxin system HicA family toxin [Chloroflexota bacterium]